MDAGRVVWRAVVLLWNDGVELPFVIAEAVAAEWGKAEEEEELRVA